MGGDSCTHPTELQSQMEVQSAPRKLQDTWPEEQSAPPQGPQVQTVRYRQRPEAASCQGSASYVVEGTSRQTQIRCNGPDIHRQTQRQERTQGGRPRQTQAREEHSQTQTGGPRQTPRARAGSQRRPLQTKGDRPREAPDSPSSKRRGGAAHLLRPRPSTRIPRPLPPALSS